MSAFKLVRQRVNGVKGSLSLTFGCHCHLVFVFFVIKSDNCNNHPLFIGLLPIGNGSHSYCVGCVACAGNMGLLMFGGCWCQSENFHTRENEPAFVVHSVWNMF